MSAVGRKAGIARKSRYRLKADIQPNLALDLKPIVFSSFHHLSSFAPFSCSALLGAPCLAAGIVGGKSMQIRKVLLATAATLALLDLSSVAQAQVPAPPISPSPGWIRALHPGPDTRVKITEEYAKLVARDAYFWAWPMVNIYNRRQAFKDVKDFVMAGPVPTAPLNRVARLTDYVNPDQRIVACPNQDVVYGAGSIALDVSPVVIQVPDFGDRFWVYQVVDLRTDGVVQLGKMYGTTPGFYLLVGPNWQGEVPKGITKVFRSST
jgi:hypothetical protein